MHTQLTAQPVFHKQVATGCCMKKENFRSPSVLGSLPTPFSFVFLSYPLFSLKAVIVLGTINYT